MVAIRKKRVLKRAIRKKPKKRLGDCRMSYHDFNTMMETRPELTVLSFGAGQDSTYLLLLYIYCKWFRDLYAPGDFLVIMSDTGCEHPRTYLHVLDVQRLCEKHGVEFVMITPDMGFHPATWQTLEHQYKRNDTIGMKSTRTKACTHNLKIVPIYSFLADWLAKKHDYPTSGKGAKYRQKTSIVRFAENYGKVRMIIGIAKGEESRINRADQQPHAYMNLGIDRVFPLVHIGADREACQCGIRGFGHKVPPPSNCMICYWMDEIELLWLFHFHEDKFWDWVKYEQAKLRKHVHLGKNNHGVFGDPRTLVQVLRQARAKHPHMTPAKLDQWKMSHGHCISSKY